MSLACTDGLNVHDAEHAPPARVTRDGWTVRSRHGRSHRARRVPLRAHRLLLPHARLAVRRRGRRAGHATCAPGARSTASRAARRSSSWLYRIATNVCLDMLQARKRRARPMDLGPAQDPVIENLATPEVPSRADPARSGRSRRRARDDPPRLRGGAPAPAAAPARGADPLRGAPLAGHRGRRAARHLGRVGQQRAPAGAGDDRASRHRRATSRPVRSTASCSTAMSPRSRRYDIDALTSLIREDATQSMPPYDMWLAGPRRHPHLVVRAGYRLQGLARATGRHGERRRRRSGSTSRARTAATSRGRCR